MNKIYLILISFSLIFSSCETDFDVNAQWQEIMVVYGLLDQSQSRQYIRVNKAYLGEGDAFQIGGISDSINFPDSILEVKIYKLLPNTDIIDSIELDTLTIIKEDGLFASDNHLVYASLESDSSFFVSDKLYSLLIRNKRSGHIASSFTSLVPVSTFTNLPSEITIDNPFKFNFYNPNYVDSLKFQVKKIDWNKYTPGRIYQVDVRFNYLENNVDTLSLIWQQPLVSDNSITLEGAQFFSFLRNNIDNNNAVREFISLDLFLTVGSVELANYIALNSPSTSLVQQRPPYTNIIDGEGFDGVGLFSSRSTTQLLGIDLHEMTRTYLREELDRNFN